MEQKRQTRIISIIIVATIVGFLSGVVGEMVARAYLLGQTFNIPLFGEINYSGGGSNGSNLVIHNPRKVVVEQNVKVAETLAAAQSSVVGIHKSLVPKTSEEEEGFNLDEYWQLDNMLGQGYILTSDGWLIANFTPQEIVSVSKALSPEALKKLTEEYLVINHNQEVYQVDNILYDQESGYSYWHIPAIDLPVKRFVPDSEIKNGELVLAINWQAATWLTTIVEQSEGKGEKRVISSDQYINEISFAKGAGEDFYGSFVFNLNSEIIALINNEGEVNSIASFLPCINCLLNKRTISRPSLGVNYLDLSNLLHQETRELGKGALIAQDAKGIAVEGGSSAELAGLILGDIIISINNIEINKANQLNRLISAFIPGDEIEIVLLRDNQALVAKVILGEK